jgi:hypothetical protein
VWANLPKNSAGIMNIQQEGSELEELALTMLPGFVAALCHKLK